MKKGISSILCVVLLIISMTSVVCASGTTLKIDDVLCSPGGIVSIPVTISGNTGIAGAVIKISYDSNLELLAVNRGDAFSSLTYTPPAKLTSNPITLLWDGIESDTSNGEIVTLQFRAPDGIGTYNVSASYDEGGIYDGNTDDIAVHIENGTITVKKERSMNVTLTDKVNIELVSEMPIDGIVYVALYKDDKTLLELNPYMAEKIITSGFENISAGKHIKVFWWEDKTFAPYCEEIKIDLN